MATPKGMRAKSIGHYILGKTIGEGTFGKVKLGTHILTGEKVAVKILEKERIVDVADVERVAREIHILKLVQHPHVIQLYEIIETPRQLYLIMEYCSGGELFDHIVASGRVREREACRFFHQIIAGVEQIHRMSVVHRDLKPENLLLDDQRNIKIVDFGLSNTFQEGQLLKTACGSPCYAAPEMIAGQRYVPARCDVWSCGVILFALVCGYLPFEDQNTAALYRKILNADYQAPKFVSENVRDMIARMLTTDPEQRYTIPRIRAHVWYRQIAEASHSWDGQRGERILEDDVLEQLDRFGFPRDYAVKCLQMYKHNHVTTTYYLLLEKKRRLSNRAQGPQHGAGTEDLGGSCLPSVRGVSPQEIEVGAECGTRDPTPTQGDASNHNAHEPAGVPKLSLVDLPQQSTAADADRAAGASVAAHAGGTGGPPKSPEHRGSNHSQWAQALALPLPPPAAVAPRSDGPSVRDVPGRGGELRGDAAARRSAASAEPPSGPHNQHHAGVTAPLSARTGGPARRHSDNHSTPRGGSSVGAAAQPTPRRRSPIQQATGFATPRGPVTTPPLTSHSATPSRSGPYTNRGEGPAVNPPPAYRSRTPGKRPSEPLSARESANARPGTSQGMAVPSRPVGPATQHAQNANEVRRRQYTAASDPSPSSARGTRTTVPNVGPPTNAASAAAAVAADLYGNTVTAGGPNSRGSTGHPTSAWTATRPPGVRASSASPENVTEMINPTSAMGAPLSAREAREEVMRTCRGAFNVSCTSSKAPKQIMQEMHRALTLQRIAYKQTSAFLVKCQKQGLRFEMEISHLDHLESIYVVRFRRVAGDLAAYKELCSKILAEMKI